MEQITNNVTGTYTPRRVVTQGEAHIIIPVVMMVEGVHSGSHGPLLHTAEELSKSAPQWNGIPVTMSHPIDAAGTHISAFAEGAENFIVGYLENARMEGNKLKAQARIQERRALATSPQALQYIKERKPLDVSIGVFTEDEEIGGEWNGEAYTAIATNHIPDHLALLPNEQGACSWADGCGVRVNKSTKIEKPMDEKLSKTLKTLQAQGLTTQLITNETGLRELVQKLSSKVDSMDNDMRTYFLEEVYDDYIIYRVHMKDGNPRQALYKQNYSIADSEEVELQGNPEQVRRQVEYVTIKTMQRTKGKGAKQLSINNNKEGGQMSTEISPCLKAKVDGLITNSLTKFSEADREWLQAQSEAQLAKLEPNQPNVNKEQGTPVTREQAIEVLGLKELADYQALMPEGMRKQVESALQLRESQRTELIKSIQANTAKDTWSEDELKTMSCEMLGKLEKSVKKAAEDAPGDYSGMGAGGDQGIQANSNETSDGVEPMIPIGV